MHASSDPVNFNPPFTPNPTAIMRLLIPRSIHAGILPILVAMCLPAPAARAQDVLPTSVDIRLVQGPAADQVQVQLMLHGAAPFAGVFSALTASIRYGEASGSTLDAGTPFCTAWSAFSPSTVVTDNGMAYRTYNGFGLGRLDQAVAGGGCAASFIPETWTTVSTITVGGTACTEFTLGNNGFTQANNRSFYISMNGVDVTGNVVGGPVNAGGCVVDCNGVPNGPAMPGTACDDGDPNTANDVFDANCQCFGTCNQEAIKLAITPDAQGDEITWAITRANGAAVASGGPYPGAAPGVAVHEQVCVSPGCYKFTLSDAGGNGINDGGYAVYDKQGDRLIDANGNFTTTSTFGTKFCLPASEVQVSAASCDNMAFTNNSTVAVDPVPGATSYQFWFFDPHGGLQKVVSKPSPLFGPPPGMNLPDGRWMNVRVKAKVSGTWSEYGPACVLVLSNPPGMQPWAATKMSPERVPAEPRLWPNPVVEGQLNVDITGLLDAHQQIAVEVQDIYGKRVLGQEYINAGERYTTTVDLPGDLANGLYLVYIKVNDRSTVHQLNVLR